MSEETYSYYRTFTKSIVCMKQFSTAEMRSFLQNISDYLDKSTGPFFKNEQKDTTTVGVVTLANHIFVIKRYNFRSFWHGLKLRFRSTRARRSFKSALLLKKLGIPTLEPVALVEERFGILRGRAYFVSEFIPGVRGCEYFSNNSAFKSEWPSAISKISHLTERLRANNIYHGDFHFGNIIIKEGEPLILDFDRMKVEKKKTRFMRKHKKDLRNFVNYLVRNEDAHAAFIKADVPFLFGDAKVSNNDNKFLQH